MLHKIRIQYLSGDADRSRDAYVVRVPQKNESLHWGEEELLVRGVALTAFEQPDVGGLAVATVDVVVPGEPEYL